MRCEDSSSKENTHELRCEREETRKQSLFIFARRWRRSTLLTLYPASRRKRRRICKITWQRRGGTRDREWSWWSWVKWHEDINPSPVPFPKSPWLTPSRGPAIDTPSGDHPAIDRQSIPFLHVCGWIHFSSLRFGTLIRSNTQRHRFWANNPLYIQGLEIHYSATTSDRRPTLSAKLWWICFISLLCPWPICGFRFFHSLPHFIFKTSSISAPPWKQLELAKVGYLSYLWDS